MSPFQIDPASPVPVFEQLTRQVKLAVALGRLRPHERLPAVRELAVALLINPNTVQRAYSDLAKDGVLYSRKGLGVFVAEGRPQVDEALRERRLAAQADAWIAEALNQGIALEEARRMFEARLRKFEAQGGDAAARTEEATRG